MELFFREALAGKRAAATGWKTGFVVYNVKKKKKFLQKGNVHGRRQQPIKIRTPQMEKHG